MDKKNKKNKKQDSKNIGRIVFKSIAIFIILLFMIAIIAGGAVAGVVLSIIKDAPIIDPTDVNASLDQNSTIYDANEELIEKIQAHEFRTFVKIDQIPKHLQDAYIAIEDERFETHKGVDPRGIVSSAMDNIKAGDKVRGASTITQQLARNVYLDPTEKSWNRKIKEAYLAILIEKALTKNQIMEAYLNRNNLGQGAYGVQEAAQTYFSKNVEDLTLAESALFAGIVKSPSRYAPYQTVSPENFDSKKHYEVGRLEILGEKYIAIYNEESVKRQKIVLSQMLKLGKITDSEYKKALSQNIKTTLKPGQKKISGISSYFTDYVMTQTVEALVQKLGYTEEEARNKLLTGGLKIYSTMNVEMQRELENIYDNFTEVLINDIDKIKGAILVDWSINKSNDVLDGNRKILYYHQDNLFNDKFELIIEKGTYELRDNSLFIKNNKLTYYNKHIDIGDYYNIDDRKNLVSYVVGSIILPEDKFSLTEKREIQISNLYLNDNEDFYRIDEEENLLINDKYFFRSKDGVVQPQSATVVLDYRTGHIEALVGGRDIEGARMLNRATASQRQPGSAIKPIATYLPALDNGYTAATPIDDIPFYNEKGELWPRNWYKEKFRGLQTVRRSIEQSGNVNAVKTVDDIGIQTSISYLEKLGIISKLNPESDSFVTAKENRVTNDENLSALGLGGMTRGLTPLELTAAYGAVANSGVYIEPISFTKIEDKNGNILIDNMPKENFVVSPQVSYILADMLRTNVTNGIAGRARIANMAIAGKTGTTQNQADIWFVGFSPYYVTGTWIGNDSPRLTLSKNSGTAAELWQHIMTKIHENLEPIKDFESPGNIVRVNVCTQSGKLPTELCTHDPRGSTVRSEIFVKGTEPKDYCDVHVELTIDISNGLIANEFCPEDNLESKIFIQTTPPYIPGEHDGTIPADFQYRAPIGFCEEHDEDTIYQIPIDEDNYYPYPNDDEDHYYPYPNDDEDHYYPIPNDDDDDDDEEEDLIND